MSGRIYSVIFDNVSVSSAQDLFEINPAAAVPVAIHSIEVGQSSDFGDSEEELLRWAIVRGNTTSGSGGTAPTAQPLSPGGVAFGGTAEVNNTTQASAGTPVTLYASTFNVRTGLIYVPTPEARPIVAGGSRIVVRLPGPAPLDALTMSGTLVIEELI